MGEQLLRRTTTHRKNISENINANAGMALHVLTPSDPGSLHPGARSLAKLFAHVTTPRRKRKIELKDKRFVNEGEGEKSQRWSSLSVEDGVKVLCKRLEKQYSESRDHGVTRLGLLSLSQLPKSQGRVGEPRRERRS